MNDIVLNRFCYISRKQDLIDIAFSCLRSELHHHTSWRICIHVSILSSNIVCLRLDNTIENLHGVSLSGDISLIPVSNEFAGYIELSSLNKFLLNNILYLFDMNLIVKVAVLKPGGKKTLAVL